MKIATNPVPAATAMWQSAFRRPTTNLAFGFFAAKMPLPADPKHFAVTAWKLGGLFLNRALAQIWRAGFFGKHRHDIIECNDFL
ncbi:MAG: hypothetical protein VX538_06570, partial [Pseudomonadota bacterium]|nr:hypothetical protein [Pseudomonadota bacterium]